MSPKLLLRIKQVQLPVLILLNRNLKTCRSQIETVDFRKPKDVFFTKVEQIDSFPSLVFECKKQNVHKSIQKSQTLIELYRVRTNAPGVSVAVSHQNKLIWSQGFGFADLETGTRLSDRSVMRIGSISKSVTSVLLARLVEQGKLDLDEPIQTYLGDHFPVKHFDDKPVNITLRQLVTHTAGIRHYHSDPNKKNWRDTFECYVTEECKNVYESLKYFKDDDLIHKPGSKFEYSSYGFSLIAAMIQSKLEENDTFEQALVRMCRSDLGMMSTFLDQHQPVIPGRAKFYERSNDRMVNVPFVNNSFKYASGGLLSNVQDLLRFANEMIVSYKSDHGFLKRSTMRQMWSSQVLAAIRVIPEVIHWTNYGHGWFIVEDLSHFYSDNLQTKFNRSIPFKKMVFHSGGSIGSASFLLILPEEELVVSVLTNMSYCSGMGGLTMEIMKHFYKSI